MREIKFRVWDKKCKCFCDDFAITNDCRLIDFSDAENSYFADNKDYKILQFTGLKDRNETEIYEGDIVEFLAWDLYYGDNGEVKEIKQVRKKDEVIFKDGKFMAYSTNLSELLKIEVVGNIYENRGLLVGYNS